MAHELEGWGWTWDASENLRFEWHESSPITPLRAAWRQRFYACWHWTVDSGSLRLVRTPGAPADPAWDALPAYFAAPTMHRPRA